MSYEATGTDAAGRAAPPPKRDVNKRWYWLLVLPLAATLIPPIYNFDRPRLIGIPFFYWYEMAMIIVSVGCTLLVYRATSGEEPRSRGEA
jgi:hypothetical protein